MTYDLKMPNGLSLDPCPFCHGQAELQADVDGVYAACVGAGCLIQPITLTYVTKRDAIKAWNWRGPASSADPIVPIRGRLRSVGGAE